MFNLLLQKKILELICKLEINLIALDASNRRALLRYFDLLVHWWYVVCTLLDVWSNRSFVWGSWYWWWWKPSFTHLFHIVLWCCSCTPYCLVETKLALLAWLVNYCSGLLLRSCLLNMCGSLVAYIWIAYNLDVVVIVDVNRWWSSQLLRELHLVIWMIFLILRLLLCLQTIIHIDLSWIVEILITISGAWLCFSVLIAKNLLCCCNLGEHLKLLWWYWRL